jgi:hypothetical protein
MNKFRHGDINLHEISEREQGEIIKHNGSFTLALGETTGHKHVMSVPNIDDMEVTRLQDGTIVLNLKVDGTLTHEEHKTLTVKRGVYKIVHEREYDYYKLQSRKVID